MACLVERNRHPFVLGFEPGYYRYYHYYPPITSPPTKIFVRGEYTKTKTDRIAFLTEEVTQQLKSWLDYKYRLEGYATETNKIQIQ